MANSKYWHNLYKEEKKKVKEYEDNIEDLQKISSSLQDDMWDEIRNVNNEIDDLKEDLNKAVRHDAKFTSNANSLSNIKEKGVSADTLLRSAVNEIENEIASLKNKKNKAIQARDEYERKYKEEKDKERKELLDSLKI